jgi:DNA invertase Pin-like site-specific DNA recombinase
MKNVRSKQKRAMKAAARRKDYEKRKNVYKYRPSIALQPYEQPKFAQKRKYVAEQTFVDGKPVAKVKSFGVYDDKGAPVLEQVGVKIKYFKRKVRNTSMQLPKSEK